MSSDSHPKKLVVHVADIPISESTGMGRVLLHWKQAFERKGYTFIHLGPEVAPSLPHRGMFRALFPFFAYRAYKKLNQKADIFLVHEAASLPFLGRSIPCVIFSHGLDRRNWMLSRERKEKIRFISKYLYPLWRLSFCDRGIKKGDFLLLINQDDLLFVKSYYKREDLAWFVFRNGISKDIQMQSKVPSKRKTVLAIGSWIPRKGYKTLIEAATILSQERHDICYLVAGTGADEATVRSAWPMHLQDSLEVVPKFAPSAESHLFAQADIFVIPSTFEGQPLALLQAMAAGLTVIASNNSGQKDVIEHEKNGLLFEAGNSAELAKCIKQVVEDEAFSKALGEQAKQSMNARDWESVSDEVVKKIEEFLNSKPTSD